MKKSLSLFILLPVFLTSCQFDLFEKDEFQLPNTKILMVSNNEVNETEITFSVSDPTDNAIDYMGICYNQLGDPNASENQNLLQGERGSFIIQISDLKPDSTYYFRSFVANDFGYSESNVVSYQIPEPTPIFAPCTINVNTIEEDNSPYSISSSFASKNSGSAGNYGVDLMYSSFSGQKNLKLSFNSLPTTGIYSTSGLSNFSSNSKNVYVYLTNVSTIQSGAKLYVENINGDSLRLTFCDFKYTQFNNEVNLGGHIKVKIN